MKSVNRVHLLGNATHDSKQKILPTGRPVCTFGLATNRAWKDASGKRCTAAEFHNLVAWGPLAEFCGKQVRKGKPLYVEGYLKTHNWEPTDGGAKQYRTEVVIENLVLLSPKTDAEAPKHNEADVPAEVAAAA